MKRFLVLPEHVLLLRRAYVSWDGCEFGAPAIDCKRPYGNRDVYRDIAKIIGSRIPDSDNDEEFTDAEERYMDELHKDTETALQIFLSTGRMEPGEYERTGYSNHWKKV